MKTVMLSNPDQSKQRSYRGHEDGGMSPAVLLLGPGPFTVQVAEGFVEWTGSSVSAIENDTATWEPWDKGHATEPSSSVLNAPGTALRFTGRGAWSVAAAQNMWDA